MFNNICIIMAKTTNQSNSGRKRPSAPPASVTKTRRRYDGGGKVK